MSCKLQLKSLFNNLVTYLFLLLCLTSCNKNVVLEKYNGVSLVASRSKITSEDIKPILDVNANAVAVMPFAFLESLESPNLKFNLREQWYGERLEGTREAIQILHQDSLKVMLKPQIWIWRGEFTGEINMDSEEDWQQFEKNYKEFILLFAVLAAEEKVEIFSLGTELFNFVKERPEFWRELIAEIRNIYGGKLTYAENWDKIENVSFWGELDYIGVDAYFPISDEKSPGLEELKEGWGTHKQQLENLSEKYGKPVIFTEYGYRNIDFAAKHPWDSSRDLKGINNKNQEIALQALYEEVWKAKWFAGGFLWKWHHAHENSGGAENSQFTPQNKPAEEVVKQYYGKFRS